MWYILIVVVAAGHIHQKTVDDGLLGLFRDRASCEQALKRFDLPPKKGVQVAIKECKEAFPELNYLGEGDE